LKKTYGEKNLEDAILYELEKFILELGQGFTFVEMELYLRWLEKMKCSQAKKPVSYQRLSL
jgi:predicted nuclease of restriction endonuclease-like (RecB) superfamily